MVSNVVNPNVDYLRDNELIGVKRRMMDTTLTENAKIRSVEKNDSNQESLNPHTNIDSLDSMSAFDIINHTISSPNIPLKYKHKIERRDQILQPFDISLAKRQVSPFHGFPMDLQKLNLTPLSIRNDHLYKLKNSACTCPLQGINYKYVDDMVTQVTGPVKILCPIHSGHPIHESIRIVLPKDTRLVFGPGQIPTILQQAQGEKVLVVKELSLACKYRMIPRRKVHILYILSLLSSTNQVSMFQLSSPLLAMSYVVLKDLNLQNYFISSSVKASTYNGPALFIATTDEFRIAAIPDSLGNTKAVMKQKYISRMHILIRQPNNGVRVTKILSHETSGRIFILDGSSNVYEFVYQYKTPKQPSMSFSFLKPLKTVWSYICTISQFVNSILNLRGDVTHYTVNPPENNIYREDYTAMKPLNYSCLTNRLDNSIKNTVLYYPPILWEALTPEVIAKLKNPITRNVCNCGASEPCVSIHVDFTFKTLNPWYLYSSVRSNSTIIDGFVDKVKNIIVVLFLNGDVIVYPLTVNREEKETEFKGFMIRGDQIQNYLYRMNYQHYVSNFGQRDLKKYHTISEGSKSDEMVANGENVVAVLSDEYGTRIYIGFKGGYKTARDGTLVKVVGENDKNNSNFTPVLAVKGFRLMPPYFSPEGFAPENSEKHYSDVFNMYRSIHKTFRIDENEYAIVQIGLKENIRKRTRSNPLFDPLNPVSFSGLAYRDSSRIDSNSDNINPLTAGPIISNSFNSSKSGTQGSINMYKITIAVRDKDTFSEISTADQGLPKTLWNSLNNTSPHDCRDVIKQVEWYDQFHIYLGVDERLVTMFMNDNCDGYGNLVIITTYHVYNIQRQTLYSLMENAINNPIKALETYDKKAMNYFPKWLESNQNKSKVPKFSNMPEVKVAKKEIDILDIAANKKYLNRDASDQLKITETQCVGFLFYLFSWVYSPQVFFSIVWKLLVNSNALTSKNVNLKHYCSNLIFPEYTNDVKLSLMCSSLGIYSKQYSWSTFTMEDKIYPWPKMLYFGSTTYFRSAKISTNLISPIVEGLLLLMSELFDEIWILKPFPPFIKQFSQLSYKMINEEEKIHIQREKHKLIIKLCNYFSAQPDYKKIYEKLDALSDLLKISIVCNSRETFKESICDVLANQILADSAHNWHGLISTDILNHRSKLIKHVSKSTSDDLFDSKLVTRSNQDLDQEYLALKNEFIDRFDRDMTILNECNSILNKTKLFVLGAIIFKCCVAEPINVNKFVNVYESSQKSARVDYTLISLDKICSDIVYEKEFLELVKNVKRAFNIS